MNVLDRLEKVEEELEKTNPFVIVNTAGHINVSAPEYVSERVTNDDGTISTVYTEKNFFLTVKESK